MVQCAQDPSFVKTAAPSNGARMPLACEPQGRARFAMDTSNPLCRGHPTAPCPLTSHSPYETMIGLFRSSLIWSGVQDLLPPIDARPSPWPFFLAPPWTPCIPLQEGSVSASAADRVTGPQRAIPMKMNFRTQSPLLLPILLCHSSQRCHCSAIPLASSRSTLVASCISWPRLVLDLDCSQSVPALG